jgi:mannosyl-oligosaccharide alpha-1,2-mannosidase
MIRDPFDIHRKNVFKATAFRAAQNIRNTAAHVGATALDMSFNIPKNVPNFGAPHRELEDRAWASLPRSTAAAGGNFINGVQSKVSHYFEDKPYGYGRRRRWWRRKRILGSVVLILFTLLWWTGFFGGQDVKRPSTSKSTWAWLGMSKADKAANWEERRQRVVEAFGLSWDTYSRYAWGKDYWTFALHATMSLTLHPRSRL